MIELGLNHEQQHQELLVMDIKQNQERSILLPDYQMPANEEASEAHLDRYASRTIEPYWVDFQGGKVPIGVIDSSKFFYDNEGGRHSVWLEPFSVASHLVTNREYLEFIEAGGYQNAKYWLSDAWEFLKTAGWVAPLYWKKAGQRLGHGWEVMKLSGWSQVVLDEPVAHLSYYEAQAFARFKGARLPTEFEWEHVANSVADSGSNSGSSSIAASGGSSDRVYDLERVLWQWTQSAYLPYPRFQAFDNELMEYNSKFMCNQMVLRGGCTVTPADHYRNSYRNFFYPHQRWQFSGLRLARDL